MANFNKAVCKEGTAMANSNKAACVIKGPYCDLEAYYT